MPDAADHSLRQHFILEGITSTERFRSPQGGESRLVPERERAAHGRKLRQQLDSIRAAGEVRRSEAAEGQLDAESGLQVEFEGFSDVGLAFESLARERSGIELLNVRIDGEITYATVFVPDGKLGLFERLITAYVEERRGANGKVLDNSRLLNTISEIRTGTIRALWTDDPNVFPASDADAFWWEVWLPVRGDRLAIVDAFRSVAAAQDIRIAQGLLEFPERTVLLAYASLAQMARSVRLLNQVAEFRRAKETAEFFDSLRVDEQSEWLSELLTRTVYTEPSIGVPHVCLLDTGVNNGHPLLGPALAREDLHTVEPGWGTDDSHGHGTEMAGLALLGDLTVALASTERLTMRHRLESVKLLPHSNGNGSDPVHHGYLTSEAVARPEITDPHRARVFGMAITARDNRDRGRPSAWSAAIDRLSADADADGASPRLLIVAAGNVDDSAAWAMYPNSNSTDGIHDPGQAWNALTVGAFTNLANITEPDAGEHVPVAVAGGLSPFSTTSRTWQTQWPLKPDVVMEGGNVGKDGFGAVTVPSLSLLTTHHRPIERSFTTANATSAATALAAQMAAQIMSEYPILHPETVRGLIVHSARWTEPMAAMFLPQGRSPSKADYLHLVRHCGFGVPDLARALWSASNSLCMIVEESLHPFQRMGSKQPILRDMQLHSLPWPLAELEQLGATQVEMRVTLSYFIEPNPSVRGFSRYRYESHGLRFDVKRPVESERDFRLRINRAARDEEDGGTPPTGDDQQWLVGKQGRHRGSLHSDIWRGTAADLASRGALAVYPSLGWWKTRTGLERWDKEARYSLIVSIHSPRVDVDLYSAVENLVGVRVETEIGQ
ncbi:MAG: S8 family peptidase [Casimicrobiaceae bacterium]